MTLDIIGAPRIGDGAAFAPFHDEAPLDESPAFDAPEPEEAFFLWAAATEDFGGDHGAVAAFLSRREAFLAMAEAAGVPRAAFLPFAPCKPGFEERVRRAFSALPEAMGWTGATPASGHQ